MNATNIKKKIIEFLIWLRDVTIRPILIVLIVALLDKPIDYHLLSPLWGFLNLEYSKTLLLFVALISIIIWKRCCLCCSSLCEVWLEH